ncbi:MAG TPA: hypothetical protein VJ698_07760 [Noviherbaspirillum sp.]|uniref:hypothetical protein n=1 Tax=Noviherbaspirillum sp. TaxID=1926288 RepID=UPI002B4A165E|nr:hypothetical protein [Noviherbaspirillum sp.]HJV85359.1 hypothetical protein [Noviherbaspirillum sp.]
MSHAFLSRPMAIAAACSVGLLYAAELPVPQPLPETNGPTTVYRQVTPDGRVVYSDKAIKGAKIDHTMTVEPPIKGNLWSAEPGSAPVIPRHAEPTPVQKVPSIPAPGKRKTIEQANADVIKAEMLLEDAKRRQEAAARGSERDALARNVADAQAMLERAVAERNTIRRTRYGALP